MINITSHTNQDTVNELKTSNLMESVSNKYYHLEECLRDCYPNMIQEDPILMMHVEMLDTYRADGQMALVNAHANRIMVRFREYSDRYCNIE